MIDLRSDVCVAPTAAMWEAMRAAPIGFAAADDDGPVAELERRGAELLGTEAALFLPSCTMANLAALLTLAAPGERVVLEASAHILVNEGDGLSTLARLVPCPLEGQAGRLDPDALAATLARHSATLVCLENSHTRAGGTVLDLAATAALAAAAHAAGAAVHLDGARLVNAAVALGAPLAALAAPADTVSLSLNKGLGAPFGALLAGGAATLQSARAAARSLGGGSLHKAGIAAAAALVALAGMEERIAADHRRAQTLAAALRARGVELDPPEVETNIIGTFPAGTLTAALRELAAHGVLAHSPDGSHLRLVTHQGITDAAIAPAAAAVALVARRR